MAWIYAFRLFLAASVNFLKSILSLLFCWNDLLMRRGDLSGDSSVLRLIDRCASEIFYVKWDWFIIWLLLIFVLPKLLALDYVEPNFKDFFIVFARDISIISLAELVESSSLYRSIIMVSSLGYGTFPSMPLSWATLCSVAFLSDPNLSASFRLKWWCTCCSWSSHSLRYFS